MPTRDILLPSDREAVDEFVRRLRQDLPRELVELRLFGSKARGEATASSDIDVLVVVEPATPEIENRVVDLAFDVSMDRGVFISPVVYSRAVRNNRLWPFTDFGRAIERDGIPL